MISVSGATSPISNALSSVSAMVTVTDLWNSAEGAISKPYKDADAPTGVNPPRPRLLIEGPPSHPPPAE